MEYLLHIFILIGIYAVLSVSLELVAGQAGLLSLAHAAFYGIGAYTSALLAVHLGVPFLAGIFSAMILAALASIMVSYPSVQLHDDYFVIATFSFQMIVFSIINNWVDITGGPLGIPAIPPPSLFGWTIRSHVGFVVFVLIVSCVVYGMVHRILTSPFGRVLRAIREDEVFAQALGKNTVRSKVSVFALSAALAAAAGAIYAHYITYIDSSNFTVMESILVISMVIIGGAGSARGSLIGAVVLVILPEGLRFIGLPGPVAANLRQIFYGIMLVIMMMVRPQGLVGTYRFGR